MGEIIQIIKAFYYSRYIDKLYITILKIIFLTGFIFYKNNGNNTNFF